MTEELTIYVVDDDDNCRESMCALVTAKGFVAEGFRSGEEFLAHVAKCAAHGCVITDYKMGGMSGLELQEQLAALGCPLPVIVVSGHATVTVAVKAMLNGAVTLLEKPHSEEQLMGAIDKAVHRCSRSSEAQEKAAERKRIRERWESLDAEQREVGRMLVAGYANKVVAMKLLIGLRTAERRRRQILQAMGVQTVPQLARLLTKLEESGDSLKVAAG